MTVADEVGVTPAHRLSAKAKPAFGVPGDTPLISDILSCQFRNDAFMRRHDMTHVVNTTLEDELGIQTTVGMT